MDRSMRCQFCRTELDLGQQFRYLVEIQTLAHPVMMDAIRRLPHCYGRPLRVCKDCQADIEDCRVTVHDLNARARQFGKRGSQILLMAAALVGIGILTARFGKYLSGT